MTRTNRLSTTAAVIVCLIGSPCTGALFASEKDPLSSEAPTTQSVSKPTAETQAASTAAAIPVESDNGDGSVFLPQSPVKRSLFALTDERLVTDAPARSAGPQARRSAFNFAPDESTTFGQRGYGGRGSGGGRNAAVAAVVIGAVAIIGGTAILVYANRPECSSTNQMASGCGYGTKVVGGAVLSAGVVGLFVGALTWR